MIEWEDRPSLSSSSVSAACDLVSPNATFTFSWLNFVQIRQFSIQTRFTAAAAAGDPHLPRLVTGASDYVVATYNIIERVQTMDI